MCGAVAVGALAGFIAMHGRSVELATKPSRQGSCARGPLKRRTRIHAECGRNVRRQLIEIGMHRCLADEQPESTSPHHNLVRYENRNGLTGPGDHDSLPSFN